MQPFGCVLCDMQPKGCGSKVATVDDDVFKALADPSRRQLLDDLRSRDGQTLHELCSGLAMARQSVSKHLAILEAANLVTSVRSGREKLHFLNAEPINAMSERWIRQYDQHRIDAITDLKTALETRTMTDTTTADAATTDFVYTTYIEAAPELVWRALTDPAFTRRYWGMEFETDWTPGSRYAVLHSGRGVRVADERMIVEEYSPFTRLSYTWQTYTKELTDSIGYPDEFRAQAAAEPRSTVTYELTPDGATTRLTVIHSGLRRGGVVVGDISGGWPKVLSWLKTFLESGRWADAA
jgi:uncharacterized protein YndB with AHSA1/START domain/DNA-binding transcriptional ArsR family regulator